MNFVNMKNTKEVILNLKKNETETSRRTLVGKIMTDRNLNKPTVISMIKKGWQVNEEVDIHELDRAKSIFLFHFKKEADYHRILKGQPWSIQGHLLNLQLWNDFMTLNEVDFAKLPFCIQFHGLPLAAFDEECAITLGNAVGGVVLFEKPEVEGNIQRSFIRVRCLINLNDSLVPEILVPREGMEPAKVTIKYERLQSLCYGCGKIGHEVRNCIINNQNPSDEVEDVREFGSWLSTPSVKTLEKNLVVYKKGRVEAESLPALPYSGKKVRCSTVEDVMDLEVAKSQGGESLSSVVGGSLLEAEVIGKNQVITPLISAHKEIGRSQYYAKNEGNQFNSNNEDMVSEIFENDEVAKCDVNYSMIMINEVRIENGKDESASFNQKSFQCEENFLKDTRIFQASKAHIHSAHLSSPNFVSEENGLGQKFVQAYRVDFPSEDIENSRAIVPALSPLSSLSIKLCNINLKRAHEEDSEDSGRATKRRLFLEEENKQSSSHCVARRPLRVGRKNVRNLKQISRYRVPKHEEEVSHVLEVGEIDFPESRITIQNNNGVSSSSPNAQNSGGWMGPTTGSQ